jgi:DNA topoisomerase-1|tara:strand:- start:149 stop:1162 length:1014 start_codon:yes stop_codon:yes gene_type:complete
MDIKRIKNDTSFYYVKNKKIITDTDILYRIKKLVIPPAWTNVLIASNPEDKVQCIGYDNKNRKQYKYNNMFINNQKTTKYYSTLIKFGKHIKEIREDIQTILRRRVWDLEKTTAFVIYIIDACHLRVGNEKYKEDNASYGITTLEKKHIIIKTTSIYIDFIGKKGVENSCKFKDSRMISLFRSLYNEFTPGPQDSFFKYYGHNKSVYTVNSCHINDFLKRYGDFSAKNFRTWTANTYIVKYLYNILYELRKQTDLSKISQRNTSIIVNKALDSVSEELNNTRNVCKSSYVCTDILDDVKKNPEEFFVKIHKFGKNKLQNSNGLESILLKLLISYKAT